MCVANWTLVECMTIVVQGSSMLWLPADKSGVAEILIGKMRLLECNLLQCDSLACCVVSQLWKKSINTSLECKWFARDIISIHRSVSCEGLYGEWPRKWYGIDCLLAWRNKWKGHRTDCPNADPVSHSIALNRCDHFHVTLTRPCTTAMLTAQAINWYREKTTGGGRRLSKFKWSVRTERANGAYLRNEQNGD